MNDNDLMRQMIRALVDLDQDAAQAAAQAAVAENLDLTRFVQKGMSPAMETIGDKFQKGEMYLPELQMAADIFEAAMAIIQPTLLKTADGYRQKGRVVIGTVKGDLHSIGKNLVATMLKTGGFEIFDLGVDISSLAFVEHAVNNEAQVIALSALLTTTMAAQREVVEALKSSGLRDRFKVIVGGAPVDRQWADQIGADAYAENAAAAVSAIRKLCLQASERE